MNVLSDLFDEIMNSPTRLKISKDLKNGIKHSSCQICWRDEEAGRQSKRQIDNKRFANTTNKHGISNLDISLSNICNLKCRTCNVYKSSFWKEETWDLQLLSNKNIKTREQYNKFLSKYTKSYDDDSMFWSEVEKNITNLSQLDMYGGEPFLVEKQWRLIKKIVDAGVDKNINIAYNTNGTLLDLEKIELLKNFKSVKIDFSIDGVNDRLYYIRYPTIHAQVLENLQKINNIKSQFNDLSLSICHTVSILNVYYIDEVFREFGHLVDDIYLNLVSHPSFYCISNIPDNIKNRLENHLLGLPGVTKWRVRQLVSYMKAHTYDENMWKMCWERTKLHDNYRKENYKDTFPEFSEMCKNDTIFSKNIS